MSPDPKPARRRIERVALLVETGALALIALAAVGVVPVIINHTAEDRQRQTECVARLQGKFDVALAHAIDAATSTPPNSPERLASQAEIHQAGENLEQSDALCFP